MASPFTYAPMREMFCSGAFSFTPEDVTHNHKLIVTDIPFLEYGKGTARICQILMKLVFQRAWLRHQYKPGCCHGGFLFQDEFSYLIHRLDPLAHAVIRSSGVLPICACQNILSMAAEEFGEQTPGSKTLGFLGLFGTKFFLANNETVTNDYAADQIGKEWKDVTGWNAGQGESHQHFGISGNMQLTHIIDPVEFTRLAKPDGENKIAEAIAYISGRCFNATKTPQRPQGWPYLRVRFSR